MKQANLCVGGTEQSSPTAEMQDSRFEAKNKNKHVWKYFKRPTSTNVHKYMNEVRNARCEMLTAKTMTHISSPFFFFFVTPNLRFQLSIYKIKIKFAYTSK